MTDFTEKQLKFLDILFDEAQGDIHQAKKLAGYAGTTTASWLTDKLKDEIIKRAANYMALHAPKAIMGMVNVMEQPEMPGQDRKLAACKEILDRGGLSKLERVQVNSDKPIGLLILPPKDQTEVS